MGSDVAIGMYRQLHAQEILIFRPRAFHTDEARLCGKAFSCLLANLLGIWNCPLSALAAFRASSQAGVVQTPPR